MTNVITRRSQAIKARKTESGISLEEYLDICKNDKTAYATAHERMLAAIGEPEVIDTAKADDPRLKVIYSGRTMRVYEPFKDFYGMEDAIESIVNYFRNAARGLEEKRQILYLLGPVGGGKSSLAERLKSLMEKLPFYALEGSPVFESPLALFAGDDEAIKIMKEEYGIPSRYFKNLVLSPWAAKRLKEYDGDISKFKVVKVFPSQLSRIGIAKTEPGDENNQDISTLVGKVNIQKLEDFSQEDTDAYSYSGALCRSTQGLMEFVEMFKAPIKVLHPLLTATQESNYNGTEEIGAIPFNGILLAHSNESEWAKFKGNKDNEAFLDRVYIVKVPYCKQYTEEEKIYEKVLESSSLDPKSIPPKTLSILAKVAVLSRIEPPKDSKGLQDLFTKMDVYNGDAVRDKVANAKTYAEYKNEAPKDEGMSGLSTRFMYKRISASTPVDEESTDAILLVSELKKALKEEIDSEELLAAHIQRVDKILSEYMEFLGKEIQECYMDSFGDFCQNQFDRYVKLADYWIQDQDYVDDTTTQTYNRAELNAELEKFEKPSGISNPKDFRNEVVNYVLRYRSTHDAKDPQWESYDKLADVIRKLVEQKTEDLLPVISFSDKASSEDEQKHHEFVKRMEERGYNKRSIRRLVEAYVRSKKQ